MSRAWRRKWVVLAGVTVLLPLAAPLHAAEVQPQLTGDTRIHDPSIAEVEGKYAAFGTGEQGLYRGAIKVNTSPDGVKWTDAGAIGKGVPKWAGETLGFQSLNVWAPSISRRGGTFFLYYCLSSFGNNRSAIGLMTNTSFDSLKPGEGWRDRGPVLTSNVQDDFNDRPVPHRFVRRSGAHRVRVLLVRDQAARARPGNRRAPQRGQPDH